MPPEPMETVRSTLSEAVSEVEVEGEETVSSACAVPELTRAKTKATAGRERRMLVMRSDIATHVPLVFGRFLRRYERRSFTTVALRQQIVRGGSHLAELFDELPIGDEVLLEEEREERGEHRLPARVLPEDLA